MCFVEAGRPSVVHVYDAVCFYCGRVGFEKRKEHDLFSPSVVSLGFPLRQVALAGVHPISGHENMGFFL